MYNKAIEEVFKRGNISTEEFERERTNAKGLCDNDIMWRLLNKKLREEKNPQVMKRIYFDMINFLKVEGKNFSHILQVMAKKNIISPCCAEEIQEDTIKCKHCGEFLGTIEQIKALLDKVKYDGRFLTDEEKQELLERTVNGIIGKEMDFYNDPNLEGFLVGLQYSAILDSRSCDFCSGHNEEALKIKDPRIKANNPPNHLGCRCCWIPITEFDIEDGKVKFKWSDIEKPDFSLVTL